MRICELRQPTSISLLPLSYQTFQAEGGHKKLLIIDSVPLKIHRLHLIKDQAAIEQGM